MVAQADSYCKINDYRIAKMERIGTQWWKDEANKKRTKSLAGVDYSK